MKRTRAVATSLAAIISLGLIAAACGGDNSGKAASTTATPTTAAAATTAAPATTSAPATTVAAGPNTPAPKPLPTKTDVTISIVSPAEYLSAIYVAQAMGEFAKENLNVTLTRNDLTTGNVLLLQGKVQLAVGGLNAGLLNAVSQGSGVTQVGHINDLQSTSCEGIYVRNGDATADGKPIPDKIKGQKVNFGGGGVAHSNAGVVSTWLKSGGLTPADISIGTLGAGDSLIALQQGAIQASYIVQPFCEQAKSGNYATLVPNTGYSFSSYMMSTDFIKNQPAVAEAILRALMRTSRTYLQGNYHDNEQVMTPLAAAIGVPEATLKASSPFLFTTDLQFGQPSINAMLNDQAIWLAAGGILNYTTALPIDKLVDTSMAKELAAGQ